MRRRGLKASGGEPRQVARPGYARGSRQVVETRLAGRRDCFRPLAELAKEFRGIAASGFRHNDLKFFCGASGQLGTCENPPEAGKSRDDPTSLLCDNLHGLCEIGMRFEQGVS